MRSVNGLAGVASISPRALGLGVRLLRRLESLASTFLGKVRSGIPPAPGGPRGVGVG